MLCVCCRPLSSAAWQRSESARVSEALAARGVGAALVRPLTIARFVDVVGELLAAVSRDVKLSTDNYVTKVSCLIPDTYRYRTEALRTYYGKRMQLLDNSYYIQTKAN